MADTVNTGRQEPWRPSHNPWLIAMAVGLAAFMEILDTAITIVALPHIAGNLGANLSEANWVMTSYLVANAIVLPISGFLATSIGRKKFLLICIIGFTLSSLFCGLSISLGMLLTSRVLQGALGGGMQPASQAILADSFPEEKRGQAFAVFGATVVLAPIIAPVLGGWITDNYSWRWMFYINIPVGIATSIMTLRLVEDPPYITRIKRLKQNIDYIGMALLALGLGSLQVMLDKGQEDDWLSSNFIVTLLVIFLASVLVFVVYELRHKAPVVDLRLFKNFNYSMICISMFFAGVVLYGSNLSLPEYLQTILGYTAQLAGIVLTPAGVVSAILLPVVGVLCGKVPLKWLILLGWIAMCTSLLYSTQLITMELDFHSAIIMRIYQAIGLAFLFVPLTSAAYFGIPESKNNEISGMVNLMRNIGGSVGTSLIATVIDRRSQLHMNNLVTHATTFDLPWRHMAQGLTMHFHASGYSMAVGRQKALATMARLTSAQAITLSYADLFWLLGTISLIFVILSFFIPRNTPQAGGGVAVH